MISLFYTYLLIIMFFLVSSVTADEIVQRFLPFKSVIHKFGLVFEEAIYQMPFTLRRRHRPIRMQ